MITYLIICGYYGSLVFICTLVFLRVVLGKVETWTEEEQTGIIGLEVTKIEPLEKEYQNGSISGSYSFHLGGFRH